MGDKTVELKEDRDLFASMLIVANSRPEISLETLLRTMIDLRTICSDKRQLIAILGKQIDQPLVIVQER